MWFFRASEIIYLIRNVKQDKPKAKFSFDVAD